VDPRQAEAFFDEHEDTIRDPVVLMSSPQEDADRGAVHQTYRNRLRSLGLVRATYKKSEKGELPSEGTMNPLSTRNLQTPATASNA